MTEREFIRQNREKWQALESQLAASTRDPDVLADLFSKVSGDLSYARTFFPNRSVRIYLNGLTQRVFDTIGKRNRGFGLHLIQDFYRHTLPREIIRSRNALLLSLGVFVLAVIIGALSTAHDPNFPTLILGDEYVSMTMENINNGDPMAVYKDEGMMDMFLGITINNVRVSMLAFVFGLTGTLGTIVLLIQNGIMLGTFQYFFYQKGLFLTSFLTIWIHGTIEIASIIIAGGAGIVLGASILFPKTHGRLVSLQIGAFRALRILLGTVPLFIAAGLLESFVTRHTEWPAAIKGGIIFISALIIIFMWIVYPWLYSKTNYVQEDLLLDISSDADIEVASRGINSLSSVATQSMTTLRSQFGWIALYGFLPAWGLILGGTWLNYKLVSSDDTVANYLMHVQFGGWQMYVLYALAMSYTVAMCVIRIERYHTSRDRILGFIKYNSFRILLSMFSLWAIIYFIPDMWYMLVIVIIPLPFFLFWAADYGRREFGFFDKIQYYLSHSYKIWGMYLIIGIVIAFLAASLSALLSSSLSYYLTNFLSWHSFGLQEGYSQYWLNNAILSIIPLILILIGTYICAYLYYVVENKYYAADLKQRLEEFGS